MSLFAGLMSDHAAISAALKALEKICANCWQGKEIDSDHLDKAVEFIEVFINDYHHRKEEELLEALEKSGIPVDGGELGTISHEHLCLQPYIKGMREAAEDYKRQPISGMYKFFINAREFGKIYVRHLEKEKNMLFPLAEWVLPPADQERLSKAFDRIAEETGAERLEELRIAADRLKEALA
ncbi:MAG: hemerythrin domain-containing protein [Thermacetogeniaceae bacterium]